MSASVVADGATDIVRHGSEIADDRFGPYSFLKRCAGYFSVEIVHASLVMLCRDGSPSGATRSKWGLERGLFVGEGEVVQNALPFSLLRFNCQNY